MVDRLSYRDIADSLGPDATSVEITEAHSKHLTEIRETTASRLGVDTETLRTMGDAAIELGISGGPVVVPEARIPREHFPDQF